MYRRTWKSIGKALLIVPLAAYQFLPALGAEPGILGVTELFVDTVFGRVTDGDAAQLVLTVGKLYWLLVFHLLFGTCISRHFSHVPACYFSRVSRRGRWFLKECLFLFGYATWYALLFLGTSLWGCCAAAPDEPSRETGQAFVLAFVVCDCLLVMTTLAVNLGTILWKTAAGFLVCWAGIVLLAALAQKVVGGLVSFLNPMSCAVLFAMPPVEVLGKLGYLVFLTVFGCILGTIFIRNYDITLREVD